VDLLVASEHSVNKVNSLRLLMPVRNRVHLVEIYFGVIEILRKWLAEYIGTATLVCVVVGSGIMGTNLSRDTAVALLVNTISTIFALALLILIIAPISGAHFNPAVSLVQVLRREMNALGFAAFVSAQVAGAITGAIVANVMFDLPAIQISTNERVSTGTLIGEVIATAGLITVIYVLVARGQDKLIPVAVAAWIGSAYLFTSSTSFANPAVTIGRVFSDTFAGINPASVLPFIIAQLVGAILGIALVKGVTRV
jgi:glycerol uptake facilitator-like aquaporin